MNATKTLFVAFRTALVNRREITQRKTSLANAIFVLAMLIFIPAAAHASPFDTGISNVSTLFTGTAAKAGSLIAVVLGGLGFAFGDPGAKKALAGTALGVGIALMAANVISWLWSS